MTMLKPVSCFARFDFETSFEIGESRNSSQNINEMGDK